ncbi:hypothetical protein B9Z19DRAFT_1139349 [Tuber borchii]|uniref:Uncharacterized protein n=1 Tax=Tuber borchii TaxID=42251 RepID=A0A2T6Z9G2_TUBBO|nr:hypothetical protein B9Z19DRAFT_1139349 [Tuber borchii]
MVQDKLKAFLKELQLASWKQAQNKGLISSKSTTPPIPDWKFIQPKKNHPKQDYESEALAFRKELEASKKKSQSASQDPSLIPDSVIIKPKRGRASHGSFEEKTKRPRRQTNTSSTQMEFDQESEENLASENMELDNEAIDSETEYDEEENEQADSDEEDSYQERDSRILEVQVSTQEELLHSGHKTLDKVPTPGPPASPSVHSPGPQPPSSYNFHTEYLSLQKLYEGGYPDPLDSSKQWFFSDSIPEEPDTSSYPPGPEATILKEIKQHQKIVEAYKRDLQLSLYLQEHGLKLVKQDSVIAGPDEVVISKPALNQLKRDLKTMGKEFRGKLEQNAELEKRIEQLEQEKKRSQEAREQQRTEIRDLSERLIERIKNL